MNHLPHPSSKRWLTGAAAGLVTLAGSGERLVAAPWVDLSGQALERAAPLERFMGGYEGVLGTSLDLIVEAARPAEAAECERQLRNEIERLRQIFSTYDPASEISAVMRGAPVSSPELEELFAAYATWSARTEGLIALNLGGVAAAWREAARSGIVPDRATLATAAQRERAFNVDALGKSFIVDRAVAVARRFAAGGVLNLGGDIRAWGDTPWTIGVADPANPAENAPPLARFTLRDAAVATSGGYARFFSVGGKRYSHLIDPRSLRAVEAAGGATVVAGDCVTANALSTAASIAGADTGARLARAHGAAGYLFANAAGAVSSGGLFAAVATSAPAPAPTPVAPPAQAPAGNAGEKPSAPAAVAEEASWPAGFQVTVQVALKKHDSKREVYRPYVVVWVQNEKNHLVRTITLWGNDERWQRKLSTWWRQPRGSDVEPVITSRATRSAGSYTAVWNGTDDFGKRLPAGTYKIFLEVCREAGNHVVESLTLTCGNEPVTATFKETVESEASTVTYGPPKS